MAKEYYKKIVQLPPELTCRKCNYTWLPRVHNVKQCPKCKTVDWNLPRVYNTRSKDGERKEDRDTDT